MGQGLTSPQVTGTDIGVTLGKPHPLAPDNHTGVFLASRVRTPITAVHVQVWLHPAEL